MSGEARYFVALAAAQEILELPACQIESERPKRLAKLTYLILEAIYESERQNSGQCHCLAAAHAASRMVETFGTPSEERKPVSLGKITFLVLELLHSPGKAKP